MFSRKMPACGKLWTGLVILFPLVYWFVSSNGVFWPVLVLYYITYLYVTYRYLFFISDEAVIEIVMAVEAEAKRRRQEAVASEGGHEEF